MLIELRKTGLDVVPQAPINVFYNDQIVGEYFADLIVGNSVIVELKTTAKLSVEHEAQLLNYLKATRHEVGLLLNYGPKPELKRKVYDNTMKGNLSWV
jgi:GxxExxY protein